jgi:hypothetical protein
MNWDIADESRVYGSMSVAAFEESILLCTGNHQEIQMIQNQSRGVEVSS